MYRFAVEWLDLRELEGSDTRAEVRDVASERSVYRRHVEPSALAPMALDAIPKAWDEAGAGRY